MSATLLVEVAALALLVACWIPIIRAELQGKGVFRNKEDKWEQN